MSPLQVVTMADQNFVLPLAVLVRSILDHLGSEHTLHLIVIDGGIHESARVRLENDWTDKRLRVSWCPPDYGHAGALPVTGRIPPLTYARLQAPSLPLVTGNRLIVLDADQIVMKDLGGLADLPFEGATVLAPRDAFIPTVGSMNGLRDHQLLGLASGAPYFSAAVMVIDVLKWREENVSARAVDYVFRNAATLNAYDQDALNAVLAGRWRELDPRFQVQPRAFHLKPSVTPHLTTSTRALMAKDPWIAHFSGRLKPWLFRGRGPFDERFHEVLSRTPFAGQAVARGPKAAFYRLYEGGLRRWAYPVEVRIDRILRGWRRRHERVA